MSDRNIYNNIVFIKLKRTKKNAMYRIKSNLVDIQVKFYKCTLNGAKTSYKPNLTVTGFAVALDEVYFFPIIAGVIGVWRGWWNITEGIYFKYTTTNNYQVFIQSFAI